jgi:endoglucanase
MMAGTLAFGQYRRGVNVSGAEFGMAHIPGVFNTDYTFNSEATFQYFGDKKLGLIRLPLLWERLQPTLGGPLDDAYLAHLEQDIAWAKAHGDAVIIDIHNFARYSMNENGSLVTYTIDNPGPDGSIPVTAADLADLWVRLSNEFKFEPTVYAYDLMNEPHDMGVADWKQISQAALSAIRANQDDKLVLVPGDSWSSGNRWPQVNGPNSWIDDPANNFAYEAHVYFDHDESGTYVERYDAELQNNPDLADVGATRVSHFINWCQSNNVRGIVDEYGIPDTDARWETVLDNFLATLDAAGMDGSYWAAGEWWGDYALSVQPVGFTEDRPQMTTLLAHDPGGYLTALSAASVSVARAASGSLVSVYGSGFTDQTDQQHGAPYPQTLAGVTVDVTDSSGATVTAGLLYASPVQVNLQMPALLAPGRATIAVMHNGSKVASGTIQVAAAGAALFTTNSAGYGLAAAWLVRVAPDGTQTYVPVAQYDAAQNAIVPAPIDFGDGSDTLFLLLYGTGIAPGSGSVEIGGVSAPVTYAGPQGQYPGLDQVNIKLPPSLAGAGQVNVDLVSGGVAANAVTVVFK